MRVVAYATNVLGLVLGWTAISMLRPSPAIFLATLSISMASAGIAFLLTYRR